MITLVSITMTLLFMISNVEDAYDTSITFVQPLKGTYVRFGFYMFENSVLHFSASVLLVNISQVIKREEEKKTILFWNSYWHWKHFQMGVGNRGFQNCSMYQNCYTTTRRSKLRDPHIVINAIVFHGVGLNFKEIKNLREMRSKLPEFNQGINPLFILFILESPKGANLRNPLLQDFFNVTYTYRSSADLYRPYGAFVSKMNPNLDNIVMQNWTLYNPLENSSYDLDIVPWRNRSKEIAWIVSHCQTENHREKYVQELKDLGSLPIDIFGKCGNRKFPTRQDIDAGYAQIAKEYKFYLAFENSDCTEYITEKFFYALEFGLLPIAMGGLSREDYEKVAPPHSYLHVKDYENPHSLMKELEKISRDEDLFNSFFWWRHFYTVEKKVFKAKVHCQLCQLLNEEPEFKSKNNYSHLIEYWNKCST